MGQIAIALKDTTAELVQIRQRLPHRKPPYIAKRRRSLGTGRLTPAERAEVAELDAQLRAEGAYQPMPKTRGECPPAGTPCPHLRCRYHLGLSVLESGAVAVAFYDGPVDVIDLAGMAETCSLHVADEGKHTYAATGRLMGFTIERIRQIEASALAKLKRQILNADDYRFPPELEELITRFPA